VTSMNRSDTTISTEAHTAGWITSVVLHGTLAFGAFIFTQKIQLAPQPTLFEWNVSMVSQERPSRQKSAPMPPTPSSNKPPTLETRSQKQASKPISSGDPAPPRIQPVQPVTTTMAAPPPQPPQQEHSSIEQPQPAPIAPVPSTPLEEARQEQTAIRPANPLPPPTQPVAPQPPLLARVSPPEPITRIAATPPIQRDPEPSPVTPPSPDPAPPVTTPQKPEKPAAQPIQQQKTRPSDPPLKSTTPVPVPVATPANPTPKTESHPVTPKPPAQEAVPATTLSEPTVTPAVPATREKPDASIASSRATTSMQAVPVAPVAQDPPTPGITESSPHKVSPTAHVAEMAPAVPKPIVPTAPVRPTPTENTMTESLTPPAAPAPQVASIAPTPSPIPAKRDYGWLSETISRRVEELKHYPPEARLDRAEGRVVIKAVLRDDGSVDDVEVFKSSGYRSLDQAALDLVKRAAPFQLPHPLGKAKMTVKIPMSYRLEQ